MGERERREKMDKGGGVPTPKPPSDPGTAVHFYSFLIFITGYMVCFDLIHLYRISRELKV